MRKTSFGLFLLLFVPLNIFAQTDSIGLKGLRYDYPVNYYSFISQGQLLKMVYVYEKSSRPNGKTVVLLHGKNFDATYWNGVISLLLNNGYDVMAPEQIGFGQSSLPAKYQYSFQQLALNTKSLLDSLGISRIILLGNSMGGMIATRFSLMYPSRVTQLILENPIGLEDWKLKVPYTSLDTLYQQQLHQNYQTLKKYMSSNYFDNIWKPEYDKLVYQNLKMVSKENWALNSALTSDMIFTQPVVYEFADLQMPAVLIIGQKDHTAIGKDQVDKETASTMGNYKLLGDEISRQIKNCKLLKIDDAGHIPHIQVPEEFYRALLTALNP